MRNGQYWDLEQKGIGRRLGRAARAGGGRRSRRGSKPLDGDGDGFYSPRPGAPDKTPVPSRAAVDGVEAPTKLKPSRDWRERVGTRLADAATIIEPKDKPIKKPNVKKPKPQKKPSRNKRNWLDRIAERLDGGEGGDGKKEPQRKERKYKSLTGVERALGIRDEMMEEHGFPTTYKEAQDMLRKVFPNVRVRGNPDDKLKTGESMAVLGLMAASEDFPEGAKLLTRVEFRRKGRGFVASAGPIAKKDEGAAAAETGWGIYFSNKINGVPIRGQYTMSQKMATEAKNKGLSDADAEAVSSIATSLHEMGHIQHNAKTLEWLGGWEGAIQKGLKLDKEKLNEKIDSTLARLEDSYERYGKYINKKPPTRQDAINQIVYDNYNYLTDQVMGRQRSQLDFDGLTEEEVKDAIANMVITEYARKSHREGVAETLAARSLGVDIPETGFHRWLAPDVKAEPQITRMEADGFKPDCVGYEYRKGSVDQEEKGLGRTLSRAGRSGVRKIRGGKPLDGDGDGFYSPRPGAPDKTPVPAGMAINAVDAPKKPKTSRNWRERIGERLADAADEVDRTKPKQPNVLKDPKKPEEPKSQKDVKVVG